MSYLAEIMSQLVFFLKIAFVIFVICLIFFRKHISAFFEDFFLDGFLSIIDEPLDPILDGIVGSATLGIGAFIPWEIGDLIAALRIFKKEKHITSKFWAFFAAAEALSFGIEPLLEAIIPVGGAVIAAPIGWFFNIMPTTLILRFIFSKTDQAIKDEKLLDEELKLGSEYKISSHNEQEILKKVKRLISREWPIDAIELYNSKKPELSLAHKIHDHVQKMINQTQGVINDVNNHRFGVPVELITILESGTSQAQNLLNQAKGYLSKFSNFFSRLLKIEPNINDLKKSIELTNQAFNVISQTAQQFGVSYEQLIQTQNYVNNYYSQIQNEYSNQSDQNNILNNGADDSTGDGTDDSADDNNVRNCDVGNNIKNNKNNNKKLEDKSNSSSKDSFENNNNKNGSDNGYDKESFFGNKSDLKSSGGNSKNLGALFGFAKEVKEDAKFKKDNT
jgi:hypothetical protein